MPDVSVSLRPGATAGSGRTATVAPGAAPFAVGFDALSVQSAPQPSGYAAPMHAPGAGIVVVTQIPGALVAAMPPLAQTNADDIVRQSNQQFFGRPPSGLGEAFNVLRQRYSQPDASMRADARRAAQEAVRQANGVVEQFNAAASEIGAPTLPTINAELLGAVEDRGQLEGTTVKVETHPAWLADP